MRVQTSLAAAAVALSLAGPALAADLKPIQDQSIDLGDVAGDAYYTVQPDGFHVVATLIPRAAGTAPVRFEAVLSSGQAMTLSSPRALGEAPVTLSIKRQNERLIVAKTALTN